MMYLDINIIYMYFLKQLLYIHYTLQLVSSFLGLHSFSGADEATTLSPPRSPSGIITFRVLFIFLSIFFSRMSVFFKGKKVIFFLKERLSLNSNTGLNVQRDTINKPRMSFSNLQKKDEEKAKLL